MNPAPACRALLALAHFLLPVVPQIRRLEFDADELGFPGAVLYLTAALRQ